MQNNFLIIGLVFAALPTGVQCWGLTMDDNLENNVEHESWPSYLNLRSSVVMKIFIEYKNVEGSLKYA